MINAFISFTISTIATSLTPASAKRQWIVYNRVQNAATELLTGSFNRSRMIETLNFLYWLSIKFRIKFNLFVITYRALKGQTPAYILQHYISCRSLRFSDHSLLVVSRSRLQSKRDCAVEVVAPEHFNAVPLDFSSEYISEKQLKAHLFRLHFA